MMRCSCTQIDIMHAPQTYLRQMMTPMTMKMHLLPLMACIAYALHVTTAQNVMKVVNGMDVLQPLIVILLLLQLHHHLLTSSPSPHDRLSYALC